MKDTAEAVQSMKDAIVSLAEPHGDPDAVREALAGLSYNPYGLLMELCELDEDVLGLAALIPALQKKKGGKYLAAVLSRARAEAKGQPGELLEWLLDEQHEMQDEDVDASASGDFSAYWETGEWHRRVAPEAVKAMAKGVFIGSLRLSTKSAGKVDVYLGLSRMDGVLRVFEAEVWGDEMLRDNARENDKLRREPLFGVLGDFESFVREGLAAIR